MRERPRVLEPAAQRLELLLLAAFFALPLLGLLVQSVAVTWRYPDVLPSRLGTRGYAIAFGSGGAGQAALNSLEVALAASVIGLLLAWPAARAIAELPRTLRRMALLLIAAPLLVPPLATGMGLTEWFIELGLSGTRTGLVLAHLTVVIPYEVLIIGASLGDRVQAVEEMASGLGLGRVRRLAFVTIPAARGVIAAAALLGFLVSWSQYGSSLAVGAGVPMLPLVLVPYVGSDPTVAAALSVLFLIPAFLVLFATLRLTRERA